MRVFGATASSTGTRATPGVSGTLRLLWTASRGLPVSPNWKVSETTSCTGSSFPPSTTWCPWRAAAPTTRRTWSRPRSSGTPQKAHWTLAELGWKLHPAGSLDDWDGLLGRSGDTDGTRRPWPRRTCDAGGARRRRRSPEVHLRLARLHGTRRRVMAWLLAAGTLALVGLRWSISTRKPYDNELNDPPRTPGPDARAATAPIGGPGPGCLRVPELRVRGRSGTRPAVGARGPGGLGGTPLVRADRRGPGGRRGGDAPAQALEPEVARFPNPLLRDRSDPGRIWALVTTRPGPGC